MNRLACIIYLMFSGIAFGQVTMDVELLAGALMNVNRNDVTISQNNPPGAKHRFELRNGYSYGLGFDLWLRDDFAISGGYVTGQSSVGVGLQFEDGSFNFNATSAVGIVKERLVYMGVTRRFNVLENTSISPFLGVFYNPYFFDYRTSTIQYLFTDGDETHNVFSQYDARLYDANERFNGSIGARLGLTVSQQVKNIGTFSLKMSYGLDVAKGTHVRYSGYVNRQTFNNDTGVGEGKVYFFDTPKESQSRHLLLLEFGFKMPCSILFGSSDRKRLNKVGRRG